MTPYTVDWAPGVIRSLADIWVNAGDRKAVTKAAARIDELLERDPLGNGRHVHEGLYRLDVLPLTVFYSVDEANRRVEVVEVWYNS
jgi:mRNA-degrading endonuclease RelE of RelBE toxin-antitoxin system